MTPSFPAFAGAAFFSFVCWFGIQWGFSLYTIFEFIACFGVVVGVVRWGRREDFFLNIYKINFKKSLFWLGAYILLYWLIYFTAPLPDLKKYLPLTWTYNVDILNYINVTQYFISPSSNPNGDFFWSFYFQTPAVFYFFAWMSVFYHGNAMLAAMPMLYSTGAAIGLMFVFYVHTFFECPRKIALIIATLILSGSFYRFIFDLYFLSSLLGCIVWLAFLIEILKEKDFLLNIYKALITPLVYQGLLLLLYPVLFVAMSIIFCFVILLSSQTKRAFFSIVCFGLAILGLFILLPGYIEHLVHNFYEFAHRTGVMGLSFLSPAAMLGLPSFFVTHSLNHIMIMPTIGILMCLAGLLYAVYVEKITLKPAAKMMIYLLLGAWGVYVIYYLLEGASHYQPWKFASYFILSLSAVFWALVYRLMLSEKIFMAVLPFFILANFLFIPIKHHAPLSKSYEKLTQLNNIPQKDLYIKMATPESTFLSVFFVRDKKLYLLSASFYYYPQVAMNNVPKEAQLFEEAKKYR